MKIIRKDPEDPTIGKLSEQQQLTSEGLKRSDEALNIGRSMMASFARQKSSFSRIFSNMGEANQDSIFSRNTIVQIQNRMGSDKFLVLVLTILLLTFIFVVHFTIKYVF